MKPTIVTRTIVMPATVVIAVSLSLLSALFSRAASETVSLDGEWEFTFRNGLEADTPELPPASAYDMAVPVPTYWRFHSDRYVKAAWWPEVKREPAALISLYGTGFYRNRLDVPAEWVDRSVQLWIGRAHGRVNVWLNGKHLGYYRFAGCFFPAIVDLSRALQPGKPNELIVSVCNLPLLNRRYKNGGFGDSVVLHVSNSKGRIESLFIRESRNLKEAAWEAALSTPFPDASFARTSLRWQIREIDADEAVAQGRVDVAPFRQETTARWSVDSRRLKPWHPGHPHLYMAEVAWEREDGTVLDRHTQRFGLRAWSYAGRTLELNAKPIYIRQRYTGPQMPAHYRYPPGKDYWLKFFRLCREVGYNSVDHYWVPTPGELAAADEVGIIVQCAAGKLLAQKDAAGEKVLRVAGLWEGIVRYTRVHPSMSILYYGGEIAYYDGFLEDVARVSRMVHSVNPRVLVMPNHAMRGIDYMQAGWRGEVVKELTPEPFPHHAERLAEITQHSDIFGHFHGGDFSYGWIGPWSKFNRELEIYERPLIAHEPPCMTHALAPYPEDGMFDSLRYGRKDVARLIAEPLFGEHEFRKWAGHPRQALLYKVSGHKYDLTMKYVVEKIRKCGNLAGYEQLVGGYGWMFDQFLAWRPGNTLEKVLKYNSDSILLLDWDEELCMKRCYWEDEAFEGTAMVSLYGASPLVNGRFEMTVRDAAGRTLLRESGRPGELPSGQVSTVGDLRFPWPEIESNRKLNISMALSGSGYSIRNDWDFWIFKRRGPCPVNARAADGPYRLLQDRCPGIKPAPGADADSAYRLWIVDALREREVAHLESGGDVLLLGSDPFPLHGYDRFQPGEAGSNVGCAVHDHPVFKDIPHEGWGDWQFAPLTARNILFEKMPGVPFDPILESFGYEGKHPQARIFEFKAGKGRLFVANCPFTGDDPVRVTLLDSILEYVTGPDFKPRAGIRIDYLLGLMEQE